MSYGELLVWIVPLTLLSTLSPMMLVQAATIRQQHGVGGSLVYLAGISVVFAPLGVVSMGWLGVGAADWAERELASKRVDAVLATLLAGYGIYLVAASLHARRAHRSRSLPGAEHVAGVPGNGEPPIVSIPEKGLFLYGLLTTATDLTGLPLYIAIAQRIGAAAIDWPLKFLTLLVCTVVIISPAWLPIALHHSSRYENLVERIRRPLAMLSHWSALLGSLAGAALLYWHAWS